MSETKYRSATGKGRNRLQIDEAVRQASAPNQIGRNLAGSSANLQEDVPNENLRRLVPSVVAVAALHRSAAALRVASALGRIAWWVRLGPGGLRKRWSFVDVDLAIEDFDKRGQMATANRLRRAADHYLIYGPDASTDAVSMRLYVEELQRFLLA